MSESENTRLAEPLEAKVAELAQLVTSLTDRIEVIERVQSSAVSMSDVCQAVAANGNAVRRELLEGCDRAANAQREGYEKLQSDADARLNRITGGKPVDAFQAELTAAVHAKLDWIADKLAERVLVNPQEDIDSDRDAIARANAGGIKRKLHPFWADQRNAMYATDEYPRDSIKLSIDLHLDGKSSLSVWHRAYPYALESYFCANDALLTQRLTEWLARHPLASRS